MCVTFLRICTAIIYNSYVIYIVVGSYMWLTLYNDFDIFEELKQNLLKTFWSSKFVTDSLFVVNNISTVYSFLFRPFYGKKFEESFIFLRISYLSTYTFEFSIFF